MNKSLLTLALAGALSITTGCASVISQSDWPVAVGSEPPGAAFEITNKAGSVVASGQTPQTITLPGSAGFFSGETYRVRFTKDGYLVKDATLDSSLNRWYGANIIFGAGGLVGLLIVDPLTGAMWELPESVEAKLDGDSAKEVAAK